MKDCAHESLTCQTTQCEWLPEAGRLTMITRAWCDHCKASWTSIDFNVSQNPPKENDKWHTTLTPLPDATACYSKPDSGNGGGSPNSIPVLAPLVYDLPDENQ